MGNNFILRLEMEEHLREVATQPLHLKPIKGQQKAALTTQGF